MGVHHARGRTYKDLFQRYRAMRGFEQRFQNGFDRQGSGWRSRSRRRSGFGGKREIEAMGLDHFARACRERVASWSRCPFSPHGRHDVDAFSIADSISVLVRQ
jgi:isoleucyl-tRNA synthetase